jgi:hypothetical protein
VTPREVGIEAPSVRTLKIAECDLLATVTAAAEDRQCDRTEGSTTACEGRVYLERGQIARHRDWHGPARRKRAHVKDGRGVVLTLPQGQAARAGVRQERAPVGSPLEGDFGKLKITQRAPSPNAFS